MEELTRLRATELALAIRTRRASAVEALRAHLDRIGRLNPALNAIVTMNPEAEAEAARADAALMRGEPLGPLHGVPITIKDCFETAGLRTTSGYTPLANYVPAEDAPTVAKLRAAGAVIIGKTNLPPLAGDSQTFNDIFGTTNNPWNLGTSPGGSSGGEGAAVAARLSPLGLGSDIGGSIRIPAHCCAVFGIKPTEHLVSTAGYLEGRGTPKAERHMNTVGPLARSIDDLELGLRIVAGPDRRFLEIPPVTLPESRPRPLRGLRVAWASEWPGAPVAPVIQEGLAGLARGVAAAGAQVEQALPDDFDYALARETYGAMFWAEYAASLTPDEEDAEAAAWGLSPESDEPFLRGAYGVRHCSLRMHTELLTRRDRFTVAWDRFFDNWDTILLPVCSVPAFDHSPMWAPVSLGDGRTLPYFVGTATYCEPFDLTGHPAVALPLGITSDSRPFGYQAVGRRWGDIELLDIARALSAVSGPCPLAPGYE